MTPEFREFPKIFRMRREIIITEKIDGTNASIYVPEDPAEPLVAGKRTSWIAPGPTDNFGFAVWVQAHTEELRALGPGVHFGEWWGAGVNKRYPEVTEKRFSLFNVSRWRGVDAIVFREGSVFPPACCGVVPLIEFSGSLESDAVQRALTRLRETGSRASPGNMRPEGIVVHHTASGHNYKITLEKDDEHKGGAR